MKRNFKETVKLGALSAQAFGKRCRGYFWLAATAHTGKATKIRMVAF